MDVTLEGQTVLLRTDDFWPANTQVRRGRAQDDATAQCDGLWGRSRRLGISPSHGASVAPRSAELRPRGLPPAASARPTAAAPDDPINAAQPRRARIAADAHQGRLRGPSRRLSTSPAHDASVAPRSALLRPPNPPQAASARRPAAAPEMAGWPHTRRVRPRVERRLCPSGPPPGALPAAIDISGSQSVRSASGRTAATT